MLKIGLLGAGRVANGRYLDLFENELTDARVSVVCDLDPEKANIAAARLKAKPTTDTNSFWASDECDLILVATESGKHYRHCLKALEAGKHVVVEKPPCMLPGQVLELESLAADKGLMFAPIFQNRLNPAMQVLKKAYDKGRFGKLVLATIRLRWCRYQDYYNDGWHGTWAMDGGVINQQAIHHVDALQWVCGPVEAVCAAQTRALNSLEAEDTTVATVRFANGALGVIEATTAARPEDFEASMSVVGEKGYAVVGGIALNLIDFWNFMESEPQDEDVPQKYSQQVPTGYGLSHGPLMQQIVDCLNAGNIEPPITGSDTIATLKLVHALYRSTETGTWVNLADNELSERLGKGE